MQFELNYPLHILNRNIKMSIKNYFIVVLALIMTSCGVSKKAHQERLYLQGIDSSLVKDILFQEPKIQKNDLLTILIYSDNKEATEIYNQPQNGGSATGAGIANASGMSSLGRGYQVDANGEIYIHQVGRVNVIGLTRQEVEKLIIDRLHEYLKNPYVVVRFANRRVTILGEVNRPGVIELPDQRVTVLEAIGLSGDLTIYGKRDNILVVREENNERTIARLNLRDPNIYASPYFYMKQNDLIYVEPNRRKSAGNDEVFIRNVGIVASVLSALALTISLITR